MFGKSFTNTQTTTLYKNYAPQAKIIINIDKNQLKIQCKIY